MFKSSTNADAIPSATVPTAPQSAICVIAKGTTIEGKFSSTETVQINGTIKGEVFCDKQLIMGPTGWIEGTIRTNSATIKGYIKGTIITKGLLHLESTAKIDGKILARTIEVEEGAQYTGECKIGERFIKEEQPKAAVA